MPTTHDEVLYPTTAQARLHLENFYLCACLNQYRPPNLQNARVLEIGCGTGFNLMPMAMEFPQATFVGIDYAESPIRLGKRVVMEIGLSNLELHCHNLLDVNDDIGEFDYITAHGFYSWVPDMVREAMWKLVQRSLAPEGIFHVSYNALPGWYPAQIVRDFARFLAGDGKPLHEELDRFWNAMGVFVKFGDDSQSLLATEAAFVRSFAKEVVYHDELAPECRPFYLSDVVKRAAASGLRYVSEADLREPEGLHNKSEVAALLQELSGDDALLQRQLLDFTSMRRFHDSLFTRAEHQPQVRSLATTLLSCWARSDVQFDGLAENGDRQYLHSRQQARLSSSHPVLCALLDALEAASPGSVSLRDFLLQWNAQHATLADPDFGRMVIALLKGGVLKLRLGRTPVAASLPDKPQLPPSTRMQVPWNVWAVNVYHESHEIREGWKRALAWQMDGTRTRQELAAGLAKLAWEERSAKSDGSAAESAAPSFGVWESEDFESLASGATTPEELATRMEPHVGEFIEFLFQQGFFR